jgi:hypothetical protein
MVVAEHKHYRMYDSTGATLVIDTQATVAGFYWPIYLYGATGEIVGNLSRTGGGYGCGGKIVFGKEGAYNDDACATDDSYMALSTSLNGSDTEKVRITAAGLVGFGITTPDTAVDIAANAGGPDKGAITLRKLSSDAATPDANSMVIYVRETAPLSGLMGLYARTPDGDVHQITVET